MVGVVTVFLFIALVPPPALSRPQPLDAGGISSPAINSTTTTSDASNDCDLVFCIKRVCGSDAHGEDIYCYCCEPNPTFHGC
ncbi:hypothetical protein EJB05_46190, partial [Eragrostis curvula]